MRKTWNTVLAMWRPVLTAVAAVVIVVGLMYFRLNTLTPGLSQPEIDTYNSTRSITDLVENSVNAPYRAAVFVTTKVANNIFGLRIVGATVGALTIVLFYLIARRIFSNIVAISTTAMFATTSILLSVSRLATANVMLLSLLAIIGVGYMIRFDKRQELAWILASIIVGLSLYVPGMLIFLVLAAAWQFRHCRKSFEALASTTIMICSVILSILAMPLVVSLIRSPELWRAYLGLPEVLASVSDMGMTIARAGASLFVISPANPVYWLGRQPILDVFAGILFVLGILSLARNIRLDRVWMLAGIFALVFGWIGLTTNVMYLIVLMPFIYLIIGFGIKELLEEWLGVFPRNPIARTLGMSLVIAAVVLSVNFQLQRYFVAWPNNRDTKAAFQLQLP